MKILMPLLAVVQLSTASASLVAVMDSGTDITHKDLAPKVWVNAKERAGSTTDLDGDGLPGDVNGWDFTENRANPFNDKYNYLITDDVKTFFNYYSKYETGQLTATSPELAWLKTHAQDKNLMNQVNFVGDYIHGTHVAGISALNNAQVKIMGLKILPTVYQDPNSANSSANQVAPADQTPAPAAKSVDEFTQEVVDSASSQVSEMVGLHSFVAFHNVDVVNQSFGVGYNDAKNFITAGFASEVQRQPTPAEVDALLKTYFNKLMQDGPKMFAAAPNTLFAIAAGNDSSNNDLNPDYPADIQADNKIVVAATQGYKQLADFSNYGATTVDVAAPGVAITSTAPTNAYIPLSGTSQATPYVVNIIAAVKDANPKLGASDLKAIVLGTVDVKDWLKGKVKTSGIVNKARALKAAALAKTMNVTVAISKAKALIADVAVDKSFSLNMKPALNINYRPVRPSLLIKK